MQNSKLIAEYVGEFHLQACVGPATRPAAWQSVSAAQGGLLMEKRQAHTERVQDYLQWNLPTVLILCWPLPQYPTLVSSLQLLWVRFPASSWHHYITVYWHKDVYTK